MEQLIVPLDKI